MSCAISISNSPTFSPVRTRIPATFNSLLSRSSSFSSPSSSPPAPRKCETKTFNRFPSFTSSSSPLSPSSSYLRSLINIQTSSALSLSPPTSSHLRSLINIQTSSPLSPKNSSRSLINIQTSSPLSPKNSSSSSHLRSLINIQLQQQQNPRSPIRRIECFTTVVSSETVSKRKRRPAKLDIPVVSMINFGDFPVSPTAAAGFVEVEGDEYSVCCKRGRRGAMEDRYSAFVNLQGDNKEGIFGVFDGHGGVKAAEFAAENLNKNIIDELARSNDRDVVEAVKNGYLRTDTEFLSEEFQGGSCCVTALIKNSKLVISNAGDCRAVVSRGGVAEALTSDHKPSRKDEKERIVTSGGYVDCSTNGVWRIQGSLAVSRGIGDRYLKQWVIAEPETKIVELNPDMEFLVLASDGLWDKVSNQEVVDAARPMCTGSSSSKPQPMLASKKLVDLAVSRGSFDDISVMIIQLQQFC